MADLPLVLYDGRCGFCREWSRRLARWDAAGRLRQVPFQDRHQLVGVPALSEADLEEALHVVLPDGRVERGARGIIALLPWLRGGRLLGMLARLPGAAALADHAYRWVARHRDDLGPGGEHCGLR